MQLNSLIDKALGLILGSAAIGALTYAQRLVYLPVGIFGAAMGMVALPALSRAQAKNDLDGVADGLDYALRTVLFLALPCTAFLLTAGEAVITFLFARGAFNQLAINETTYALAFYLAGLPAFCCAKVATNPFHARKDTKTPMLVGISCMFLNLALNLILMRYLRQGGLALATSICSWLNVAILLLLNRRHLPQWSPAKLLKAASALLLSAAAAAIASYALVALLARSEILAQTPKFIASGIAVAGALLTTAVAYIAFCLLLKRPELRELLRSIRRR